MEDLSLLGGMALFVEVARTGSFTDAARNLGVPTATLSRRIAAMEREFCVCLFHRNTRYVQLTDAGLRYFERCGVLVDEARLAHESLREVSALPSGLVRITMPVDLGVHYIGPLLSEFAQRYPEVSFECDLSPRYTDLVHERIHVAIRMGMVTDERVVARRIAEVQLGLYAAPDYLAARGTPLAPAELARHECILIGAPQTLSLWRLSNGAEQAEVNVGGRFGVNNMSMMRCMAERGHGIALLPYNLGSEALASRSLCQVLPDWYIGPTAIFAVTPSRHVTASVRCLLDFLEARLRLS